MNDKHKRELQFAKRYRKAAIGHANSAIIVHKHLVSSSTPREDSTWISLQNLIGLAAECAFKSYLVTHGVAKADLYKRDVGHNLAKLFSMCLELHLGQPNVLPGVTPLSDQLSKIVKLIGDDHGDYNYRYIESKEVTALHPGASTENAIRAIQALADVVELELQGSA